MIRKYRIEGTRLIESGPPSSFSYNILTNNNVGLIAAYASSELHSLDNKIHVLAVSVAIEKITGAYARGLVDTNGDGGVRQGSCTDDRP